MGFSNKKPMFADRQTGTMTPSIRTYAAVDCSSLLADNQINKDHLYFSLVYPLSYFPRYYDLVAY